MVKAVEKEAELRSLHCPWLGRPAVLGGIWKTSAGRWREALQIPKDDSGLPGSHREGCPHSKAQGLWGRVPTPSGCRWGGPGQEAGRASEGDLGRRAREQTLSQGPRAHKKS